ncbi:MAG: branched-chain amino acid ABC transporter permease [candidate division Zixibacteria bacterium]|nr:branched-chain amino acid ABC transporter permease [candidate division Zixibacteria bacterium]
MLQQIIVNSLIACCFYFLVALGFSVIYSTVNFFHFAHGIVFTAGAYFVFLFTQWLGMPLWISIVLGIAFGAILGCLMEILVYRPFHNRGSSGLVLLLASLGMYILLQNVISMAFGDNTQSIRTGTVQEGINILGARITPIQIITIGVSIVLVIALSAFLKVTRIGKSMRAVANDPELANISGIHSNRVILWAFAIGSALAGLAGILVALDVDMTPTMGMNALMMGVVAVIIGGVRSIPGIALGALLLATAQHLGAWYIGSQWQEAIAFVVLVLFLLFRPEGFMGKKIKSATV